MAEKWDKGTSDDALLVPFRMDVTVNRDTVFEVSFQMPADIKAALRQEDFDFVELAVTEDAKKCYMRGILMGYGPELLHAVIAAHVADYVPDALYRRFVHRQIRAGNEEWAVPVESMGQQA